MIRVYDDAGNVIDTHEHKGDFKEPEACLFFWACGRRGSARKRLLCPVFLGHSRRGRTRELDPYVLAATITNCAFRRRHRWNAVLNLFPLGKWMVLYRSFCMGNGYFSRSFSAESHRLWSDGYLSAETEKSINMDGCRLITNAPRSFTSVENALTNR